MKRTVKGKGLRLSALAGACISVLALAPLILTPVGSQAATAGLVASYAFGEGAGTTVADSSGNGHTGTVSNTTWTANGKFGPGLVFNGTNAKVTIPDAATLHLSSAMTLEAWVKPASVTPSWRDVIYKGDDNYFLEAAYPGGGPAAGVTTGSSDAFAGGPAALPVDSWTHIAATYDGANIRLYVNGVQVASQARTGTIASSTNPLQIGGDGIYGQYFNGTIDEARIYSTVLTAAQIQSDMTTPVGIDSQPPTTPTNLLANAASGTQINLSWTASTDNVGVSNYLIERCQGTGCSNFTQIATSTTTSFNNTGLTAGNTYSYRVRATDASSNTSPYSNTATATTPALDSQPPTAPSSLAATPANAVEIDLAWTAATDNVSIAGYRIERCQGANCTTFNQIGTTNGTTTTYNDTNLTPGTSYSYRLLATDPSGNQSPYSNTATAATPADTQPPTAPANLTASPIGSGRIDLAWSASTDNLGVTGYRVERCQGSGCSNFAEIGIANTNAFSDTGLTPVTAYSYRVRASDAAANLSGYSNVASGTTQTAVIAGLVASYAFGEGAGTTVADSSGNGHTGTVSNTTWTANGKFGPGLVFNGTNAKVTIPDAATLHLSSAMTLEAWVKPASVTPSWRDVIYKGDDNYFLEAAYPGGGPAAGVTTGSSDAFAGGPAALPVDSWTHIAATYDGANIRLYVNGVQVASQARTGTIASSTNPLQIGGDGIYGQYFNGTIDEARIYSTVLTAAQIQSDMTTPVGIDSQPPTTPTNLLANAASGTQINLSWTASTDNVGVSNYLIERCQGTGCSNFTQIATSTTTSFNNTGLTAGNTYSYRVRATDASSNTSPYSNTATATTPALDSQPPTAPSSLAATPANAVEIDLAWTAATDNVSIAGYRIERCQGANCTTFNQIGTTNGTTTTYNDTNLTPGTSYSYRLLATDPSGNQSPYSNTATAATPADTQPPTAPGTLSAAAASSSQIDLVWGPATDDAGVTGYRVDRCQGTGCSNFSHRAQLTGPQTTYSDTGLTPATSYSYQVRAMDAAGNLGPVSNTATTTTSVVASTLVAAYAFDEGSGTTVADSSGNGNNGTVANGTWTTNGKFGPALVFNGTSTRVTVPDAASLDLSGGMTLEAWINPMSNSPSWRDVIYKPDDTYLLEGVTPDGTPGVGATLNTGHITVGGSNSAPVGAWTFLAATYDGANIRLYVNGDQVSSTPATGLINPSSSALQIGGDNLYGQYFNGMIDEARIYDTALTTAQIQADMSIGIGYPSAPSGFSAAAVSPSEVDLSWLPSNDHAGITGYQVERCQGAGCSNFTQIATPTGTTLSDTGLTANTSYSYRVRAVNTGSKLSGYSATASAFTGLVISPRTATLTFTRTQQFVAQGGAATWSVDGVNGGNASTGTIAAGGLYTPPTSAGTHIVTATAGAQSVSATVYVSNYPGIFTFHNNNARTGANTAETVLTPSNVSSSTFGKLVTFQTDGIAHASPLYVANLAIPGQGFHNVVYVATEHDSVYAFDADGLSNTPIWKRSFINPGSGITTVTSGDVGECCDITPEIGITSTPVIDTSTNTMYVVAKTKETVGTTTNFVQRLHALDITTGAEKFGGPVVIQASVPGTGIGSSGGTLPFNSLRENQRTALLLLNGVVYMAFGSHGDNQPYHGWALGYSASTLQQLYVFCSTPDGEGGGIWQSGDGLAADANGSIYLTTGDGKFDANSGGKDYGDSYLRLNPNLTVADYFTPSNQSTLDVDNSDLGAGGLALLPTQPGPFPNLMTSAGKNETIDLVDRDNMGHFNANGDSQIVQSLPFIFPNGQPETGNYSAPVYFNGDVFYSPVTDVLQSFPLTNGLFPTSSPMKSAAVYPYPGGAMSVSANGSSNGILWAVQRNDVTAPGVLFAYDPRHNGSTLQVLYSSAQAGTRDTLDLAAKFSIPTVANGKVYVASNSALTIYGLLP